MDKLNHISSVVSKNFQKQIEIGSLSIFMFDRILRFQNKVVENGHIGEIGVNLGITSGILSCYLKEKELLWLCDPYRKKELVIETIRHFSDIDGANVIFEELTSANADLKVLPKFEEKHRCLRFIHIDGLHSYEGVMNDLQQTESYLTDGGVIVVDDFMCPNSACITQAVYDFIRRAHDLKMFAIANNKAYLCRVSKRSIFRSMLVTIFNNLDGYLISYQDYDNELGYISITENKSDSKFQIIGKRLKSLKELQEERTSI